MARPDGPLPALLVRLRTLNPTTIFLATLALALIAMLTPGVLGAAMLLVLVVALITLARLTWRYTPLPTRAMRVVVLAALIVIAVVKIIASTR